MISLLFLYDPLYASSHDLESDYPWSGLNDENSPAPKIIIIYFNVLSITIVGEVLLHNNV